MAFNCSSSWASSNQGMGCKITEGQAKQQNWISMKEILKKLEDFFGCPMPNPLNYPNSFKYYMMVYHYHNKKTEIREDHK